MLWHYLWLAPRALEIAIVILMVWRGLARQFPLFTLYLSFSALQNTLLFVLDHSASVSAKQYWTVHWIGMGISTLLRFALIYEIFHNVFKPYPSLLRFSKVAMRWAAALLFLIAVVGGAYFPADNMTLIQSALPVADGAVNFMQAGILLFLFAFSSYFHLSWRSYVFGIAMGFGVFSLVKLGIVALQLSSGWAPGSSTFNMVIMATYHGCLLIWLAYLLAPERTKTPTPNLPTHNLEDWNQELQRLLTP